MKKGIILEKIQNLMAGLKLVGKKDEKLGKLDSAVLQVAMAIAGLDGHISEEELRAFETLAKKCRGYNAASAKDVFRRGLRTAGYVELAARTLSANEVESIFVEEALRIMPNGFVNGSAQDIRRAFVMWTAMAMADGDYSEIEDKSIMIFAKSISSAKEMMSKATECFRKNYSPSFVVAYENGGNMETVDLDKEFFETVRELIAKLGIAKMAETAAEELKKLIING